MAALNPQRYVKVLGSSFVKDYTEHPMLVVGRDQWTRAEMGKLGVVQVKACSILASIARTLKAKSLRDLYDLTSPYVLAEHPCGVVTLYVLFAVFYDKDLDVDAWYKAGQNRALTTFTTLKHKELEARAREKSDEKRRNRKSTRATHERSVSAFLQAAKGKAS